MAMFVVLVASFVDLLVVPLVFLQVVLLLLPVVVLLVVLFVVTGFDSKLCLWCFILGWGRGGVEKNRFDSKLYKFDYKLCLWCFCL